MIFGLKCILIVLLISIFHLSIAQIDSNDDEQDFDQYQQQQQQFGHHKIPIPFDFECDWRKLALDFSIHLQPFRNPKHVFDSLQFQRYCNSSNIPDISKFTINIDDHSKNKHNSISGNAKLIVYLAPWGSDSNDGSFEKPFRTFSKSLSTTRTITPQNKAIIMMREGIHVLLQTITFGSQDSGLSIQSYNSEMVILTGARPLTLDWKLFQRQENQSIFVSKLSQSEANFFKSKSQSNPNHLTDPASLLIHNKSINGTISEFGKKFIRSFRARYPNAHPETTRFPKGWLGTDGSSWIAPQNYFSSDILIPINEGFPGHFKNFTIGVGGPFCGQYFPPEGYWCSSFTDLQGKMQPRWPMGLIFNQSALPHAPYNSSIENVAVLHSWRIDRWFVRMFQIDSYNKQNNSFGWSYGGFQGAQGCDAGAEFFIENVFEELDFPNEWFFDSKTNQLFYVLNETENNINSSMMPKEWEFWIPVLVELMNTESSMDNPLVNFSISGITFVGSAATFLDLHGMPSSGDWAIPRSASLRFKGTVGCLVQNCSFYRLDGNALMIDGYNRNLTIQGNEFSWLGMSAIVSWGYTQDFWDGTGGNQPRFSKIIENRMREIGIFQKQSSCYFQAKSCQTTLSRNVCFNGPRAGFNFNDGFGGGNDVSENLIFNMCRETSDHGPINSWDRQPFLSTVRDPTLTSVIPAYNDIHHNFLVANYYANMGAVDSDDGSSYYLIHHNFNVFGGQKSFLSGHSKHIFHNLVAFPRVGSVVCFITSNLPPTEFTETYANNTCILPTSGSPYLTFLPLKCDQLSNKTEFTWNLGGNKVFAPDSNVTVGCRNNETIPFSEWQDLRFDPGTTLEFPLPNSSFIIQWAIELLFSPKRGNNENNSINNFKFSNGVSFN